MMKSYLHATLSTRQEEIKNQLIAGALDKKVTRALLVELSEIYDYKASEIKNEAEVSQKYVIYGSQIEAVVAYLKDVGEPREIDEAIEGVRAGGFRGGGREQIAGLNWSIKNFLDGTGAKGKKAPIKKIGDKIGLKSWPDSKWES